jgi:hypothetical protein
MTLLSIAQSVLAENGWPVLGAIASNLDATAQQVFALANKELRATSELYSWPQLEMEYPFTTIIGQTVYPMPIDFKIGANHAIFNASEYYSLRGADSTPYWQLLKYGKLSSLTRMHFKPIFVGGVPCIELTPAPTTPADLVLVYFSKDFALDSTNIPVPRYSKDDDTSRIPERVVELGLTWRFRRSKGLDFSVELAEYQSTVAQQFAQQTNYGDIQVGGWRRPYEEYGLTTGYIPENGFG